MVPLPALHAILDVDVATRAQWSPLELGRAFLDGGAQLLQIRAKHLESGPLLDLCDAVLAEASRHGARVIVNDRVDVARLCGAAGVHVGQDDVPAAAARAQLGPDAIVGLSTHSMGQIAMALAEPVSYVAVGPVFGTVTKDTGYDRVGLELVSAAARACAARPLVAIGGITIDNAGSVIRAGATSVAVISDLLATGDPAGRVRAYVARLGALRADSQ